MKNNLKKCPFCGGEAKIKQMTFDGGMDGCYVDWIVSCTVCRATIDRPADNFYGRKVCTEEDVIRDWNKRVEEQKYE